MILSVVQVIEELFTYWNLDDADETLEELEDALIVRPTPAPARPCIAACLLPLPPGRLARAGQHVSGLLACSSLRRCQATAATWRILPAAGQAMRCAARHAATAMTPPARPPFPASPLGPQMSDFGPRTAFKIVDGIREKVLAGQLKTGEQIRSEVKASITSLLEQRGGSTELALPGQKPAVLLVVGVNGGGKTTTVGKLAHRFGAEGGARVVLAAGDTFRAAAAEQLEEWGRRAGAEVVRAESDKARPDTVLYQAVDSAVRSGADLVLCDTSGRLHTNWSLMDELAKCKRALAKRLPGAPHEVTAAAAAARCGPGCLVATSEVERVLPAGNWPPH
jgi:hypothetical protein